MAWMSDKVTSAVESAHVKLMGSLYCSTIVFLVITTLLYLSLKSNFLIFTGLLPAIAFLSGLVLSGEKQTALRLDVEVCKLHDVYDILPDFFGVTSCT